MKYARCSRRMFLQGGGGLLLGIPTLGSLLWKRGTVQAQPAKPPVRYVQWVTNHGQFDRNFWPDSAYAPTEPAIVDGKAVPDIKVRPLGEIQGRMSSVLHEAFDPLRPKLNIVRGLDLMVVRHLHNACVPTCASWPREDNHIPYFAHSVDSVLETSPKIYPTEVRLPALRLTPGVNSADKWGSFCWTTRDGKPFKLPAYDSTEAAIAAIFPESMRSATEIQAGQRLRLVDRVLEDYRQVTASSSLGETDKRRLDQYMDLLADVQRRTQLEAPSCVAPQVQPEKNFDVLHQNAIDLSVAAMLCGATRIVAYHCYQGSPSQYDEGTFHAWAHNDVANHGGLMAYRYRQLARLLTAMDQAKDSDGNTLLDNSLVYACNELSDPGHGAQHLRNMPVITAGRAGGRMTTGAYIDYSGRLLNRLLVSIYTTLGLEPADYERNQVVGFGDYEGSDSSPYASQLTTAKRRSPLPVLCVA